MKAIVVSTPNAYGFGRDWHLKLSTAKTERTFYLGQDAKVCNRILGMSPSEVVRRIGTSDIGNGTTGARKLGRLIVDTLGITGRDLQKLEPWAIACE